MENKVFVHMNKCKHEVDGRITFQIGDRVEFAFGHDDCVHYGKIVNILVYTNSNDIIFEIEFDKFDEISEYDCHLIIDDFVNSVKCGAYTDDDGFGYYATADKVSNIVVNLGDIEYNEDERPKWATHIVWYNR